MKENKKGTVTIPIEDYENMVNGFELSKTKEIIEKDNERLKEIVVNLQKQIETTLKENYIAIEGMSFSHFIDSRKFFILKDKTPNWIKKLFNK